MRSLWVMLLLVAGFGVGARAELELRNGIAAIVNDAIITFQEVEDNALVALEALRRPPYQPPAVFQQKRIEALNDSLESLVAKQLILQDFKSLGGALPESIIEEEIKDRIRKRYGDRVTLTKSLQAQNTTMEQFRQQAHDYIVLTYMRHRNISQAILISPQKIEQYYTTNLHEFKLGDQVKLRMIVLNAPSPGAADEVKRLAREILAKIEEGASFAEMAGIYSEGSQRSEGGDWGWREQSYLRKGLSDIAFALPAGRHSEIVALAAAEADSYWIYQYDKTGRLLSGRKYSDKDALLEEKTFGPNDAADPVAPKEFYLMLVEDRRAARVRTLEEVRDEIEKRLLAQERARLEKKWIERLRLKSFVRYFN